MLLHLLACLPLPAPDFRRPATLVHVKGEGEVTVRVCTWSMQRPVTEGCDNVDTGVADRDGIGVPEWTTFPLVLRTSTPFWADAFVACEGTKVRAVTLRLPGAKVKHKGELELVLDAPVAHVAAMPGKDLDDGSAMALAATLCDGTVRVREAS